MTRNRKAGLSGLHGVPYTEAHVGIFSLTGPGVRPGAWLGKISVLDVAPTLAYVLDLPIADALPGRVLQEAFTDDWVFWKPVDWLIVPSWEDSHLTNPLGCQAPPSTRSLLCEISPRSCGRTGAQPLG